MKTPKTNFVQLDKLEKQITGNQGFRKSKSQKIFELDSNNTSQHIQHKGKLVLVNAYQIFQYDQLLCNAYDDMTVFSI